MMFGWLFSFYYYLHFLCMMDDDGSPYETLLYRDVNMYDGGRWLFSFY